MSLAIYRNVVALGRTGALAWAVVLALWALMVVWIYPSIGQDVVFADYVDAMPEQMRAAIGVTGPEEMALVFEDGSFTLVGYLNTEYLAWMPLLLGIYAVVYCGGLVSREMERGTLDATLAQPVSRTAFLLSKFAGFATLALGATVVSLAALLLATLLLEGSISAVNLAAVHAVAYLLAMAIAAYSTLVSAAALDPGRSLALAGIVTALSYFANILGVGITGLGWLKWLSLFHYYDSLQLAAAGEVNWAGVGVYAGVLAGALIAAALVFSRRDLVR